MRNITITGILILLVLSASCSREKSAEISGGNEGNGSGFGEIRFEKTEHDLGTITQGEKVGYNFSFTNAGEGSLLITDASASCGCTVPRYSKAPVPPGESGTIEVVFDSAGRIGKQNKTITIKTNGKKKMIRLTVKANIINANS
jgi:hypothetical protein